MKYANLAGRLLFAAIFIFSSFGHFNEQTIAFASSQGLPFASLLVPVSGIVELAGGLSILAGYRARTGGLLLILFLLPVTLIFHQFWTIADPMASQIQMAMFMKNVSIMGAALMVIYFGSGELSIDRLLERRKFVSTKPAIRA